MTVGNSVEMLKKGLLLLFTVILALFRFFVVFGALIGFQEAALIGLIRYFLHEICTGIGLL